MQYFNVSLNFFRLRKIYSVKSFLILSQFINTFQKLQKFLFFERNIFLNIIFIPSGLELMFSY